MSQAVVERSDAKRANSLGKPWVETIAMIVAVALTFVSPWFWILAVPVALLCIWALVMGFVARVVTCPYCGKPTEATLSMPENECMECRRSFGWVDKR